MLEILLGVFVLLLFMALGGFIVHLHYKDLLWEINLRNKLEVLNASLESFKNGQEIEKSLRRRSKKVTE